MGLTSLERVKKALRHEAPDVVPVGPFAGFYAARIAGVSIYDASGVLAASGNTDASGFFKADGLDAGTYHVVTWNLSGWVDESADGSPCEGSCEPLSTAPVTLGAAEALVLDFVLQVGHWVPVYITDA